MPLASKHVVKGQPQDRGCLVQQAGLELKMVKLSSISQCSFASKDFDLGKP